MPASALTRYHISVVPPPVLLGATAPTENFPAPTVPRGDFFPHFVFFFPPRGGGFSPFNDHGIQSTPIRFPAQQRVPPARDLLPPSYDETDLHLSSVCEEEGIHYHFEPLKRYHLLGFGDDFKTVSKGWLAPNLPISRDTGMVRQRAGDQTFCPAGRNPSKPRDRRDYGPFENPTC